MSYTHGTRKTPHVALIAGATVGFVVALIGRHKLVLSPEEEFAMTRASTAAGRRPKATARPASARLAKPRRIGL